MAQDLPMLYLYQEILPWGFPCTGRTKQPAKDAIFVAVIPDAVCSAIQPRGQQFQKLFTLSSCRKGTKIYRTQIHQKQRTQKKNKNHRPGK